MTQQDNFSGGFLLGAILGGIAGGVLGVVLANRTSTSPATSPQTSNGATESPPAALPPRKRGLRLPREDNHEQDMENARRSLENKIAQLNDAIDDVRQQLSGVNGRGTTANPTMPESDRSLSEDL
ncbi:MAG: hypothetical protein VKJ24_03140 [Synechococcales bacterium]|nr:hypothetical protein [Synechococcales bacterium]